MKARIAAASLGVALLVVVSALPAAALEPHENPDAAPLVFDGVAVLQKYSQALDYVLQEDTAGMEQLREQSVPANIPPELRNTVDSFLSSSYSLAGLIPLLKADFENSKVMLAQYRVEDAMQSLTRTKERLTQAYSSLLIMGNTVSDTGRWWKIDSATAGSALRQAYDEVQEKLRRLRQLLDLLDNMNLSLTRQTDAILAITEGDILRPTTLTLSIEPGMAFVGDKITFRGTLSSEDKPLSGRIVTVLLDNAPVSSVLTNNGGIYHGDILLPYRYVPEMKVQALFYPVGNDIGQYLGTSSPVVTINVLYYKSGLNIEQGTPANPGRDFLVQASFNYGDNPPLEERNLSAYLDNELILETTVGTAFHLRLSVPANTSPGMHRLTFYATPHGRYAPVQSRLELEVTRIVPVVEVNAPGLILLPFTHDIGGKVYSSLGPLKNAGVEITLGGWAASAATQEDGTFHARLATGMSLTWLGSQDLRIAIAPEEPWHKADSVTVPVLVINPVNIAGILLILTVPILLFSLRRRTVPAAILPATEPVHATVKRENQPLPDMPEPASKDTVGTMMLALYRGVLRMVQAVTALVLQPCQTLREFAKESAPGLGALGVYFQEFTTMVEKLLYSRHGSTKAEAIRARELSHRLMKGVANEGP